MLEPASNPMTKTLSVFISLWLATLEKGGGRGFCWHLLLHIKACGYFDFSLCLPHTPNTHTPNTHTQQTLQTRPSSVLLLYCSRCNFYDFEASQTHTRSHTHSHTHCHLALGYSPFLTVCYFATLLANRRISLPSFVIY